jgi:activating signal cointegrator complex subunit 3
MSVAPLLQAFVSRARVESFSLTADMMYVSQNAPRILRAVFEIALRRKWSTLALTALRLCQCMEKRLWENAHPLRQFDTLLSPEVRLSPFTAWSV